MSRFSAFLIGLTSLLVCSTAIGATIDEIRQKFQARDWQQTLRAISDFDVQADSVSPQDRYDLYMMKGESLVQMKSGRIAATAFDEARKSTTDVKQRVQARAMAVLCRRCSTDVYRPQSTATAEPISILAPESRKQAMLALFDDLVNSNQRAVVNAENSSDLGPILDAMPLLGNLFCLEVTATGKDDRSKAIFGKVGSHAREMISTELSRLETSVGKIRGQANGLSIYGGYVDQNGLQSMGRNELLQVKPYLDRIQSTVKEGRRAADIVGGDVGDWQKLLNRCDDLQDEITALLNGPGVQVGG